VNLRRGALAALLLATTAVPAAAQANPPNVSRLADAFRDNQAASRDYTWTARTRVTVAGELHASGLHRVRHLADGTVQRTPVDPESTDEAGAAKKKRGKKQRKTDELILELRELLDAYLNMPADKARSVFARAKGHEDPAGSGIMRIQMRGVVYRGDSMDIWMDAASALPSRFEVFTALYGEAVMVKVEYRALDAGPAVPALATVETELKEKKMEIRAEIFDHEEIRP
jgi:hypothetical protein